MEYEEPSGVTFHLDKAEVLPPCSSAMMVARARVVLTAEIYDEDVWNGVLEKLGNGGKGMRIYTVSSFAEELVDVVSERFNKTILEHARVLAEKDEQLARLAQQLSFAKADAQRLQQAVGVLVDVK